MSPRAHPGPLSTSVLRCMQVTARVIPMTKSFLPPHRLLSSQFPVFVAAVALFTGPFATAAEGVRPLKGLMITGGCCHDYTAQKDLLAEGLSARANIEWTVIHEGGGSTKHQVSVYAKPDWAAGYDVVVHNECFADEKDVAWLDKIVKPHHDGVPAVVIHCAMHCYRAPSDEWFKFVGVTSRGHGSHFPHAVKTVKSGHPIMQGFPEVWETPKEELYNIEKVWPTAIPLASSYSPETKKDEVDIWINTYGKGRVFGTTIGHYNHTMQDPIFLDLVARGLLWTCDKLDDQGKPRPGYEVP